MKYGILLFFLCSSCSYQNESIRDVSTKLKSEINQLHIENVTQGIPNKKKHSTIAFNHYMKHNTKLSDFKKYKNTTINKEMIRRELRALHQSSIDLRDSLVLRSPIMNYSCIKRDFVKPKTNIPITMGSNWDSLLIENYNDTQLDSMLNSWEIHNLEWQLVVLELVNDL